MYSSTVLAKSYCYPFDEFLRHYDGLRVGGHRPISFVENVSRAFEYMKSVCGDNDEARWKLSRFILIMQYVAEHITEFDTGDFAVNGSPKVGALVGEHLLRAVHEIFTSTDLDALGQGPSPRSVLELAAKFRTSEN